MDGVGSFGWVTDPEGNRGERPVMVPSCPHRYFVAAFRAANCLVRRR
jgi:hypothetical protein